MRARLLAAMSLALFVGSGCSFFDPVSQGGYSVIAHPRDTALLVGGTYQLRGTMMNSFGDHYPSSHIEFGSADTSVAVAGVTVTGLKLGRATIVASREDLRDTVHVSVVPAGRLAGISDSGQVRILRTDGALDTSVAAGQRVAWLPNAGGIVYQSINNAIILDDLKGRTRQLAVNGTEMRASHDGLWVYYTIPGNGIWRVHQDGTGVQQVTVSGGDGDPEPSPDGTRLVFRRVHFPDDGLFQVEVRDLGTGAEQELAHYGLRPRWSPDGSAIAFVYDAPGLAQDQSITVMNADGSGSHQVSPAGVPYWTGDLDWSPDGKWLAVHGPTSLELLNVASGQTLPLGYATNLTWVVWQR